MEAVVLEKQHDLRIRDISLTEPLGPHDVRIDLRTVGVCGSDVHYYEWGITTNGAKSALSWSMSR